MSSAADHTSRLSLSEIVRLLLSRTPHDRSSVSLTRNAKGVTQIDVTVRTGDDEDLATPRDAEKHAVEIYERLRARYPMPDGFVGAEREGAAS
jgi:hypothetical protein